jgi:hypothetical protein
VPVGIQHTIIYKTVNKAVFRVFSAVTGSEREPGMQCRQNTFLALKIVSK